MRVTNWNKWQSYRKDRGTPPWIKVYRNLLSNSEWAILTDAEKGQIISIWILAADKSGIIPDDARLIQKMCMLDEAPDLNKFKDLGFLDVTLASGGCQVDAPETETETETETDKKEKNKQKVNLEQLSIKHISDWLEKKRAVGLYLTVDEDLLLEKFKNYCQAKDKRYKDYVAAFRNSFNWDNPPTKRKSNNKNLELMREAMK
jgi:hypothetical protein